MTKETSVEFGGILVPLRSRYRKKHSSMILQKPLKRLIKLMSSMTANKDSQKAGAPSNYQRSFGLRLKGTETEDLGFWSGGVRSGPLCRVNPSCSCALLGSLIRDPA